MVDIENKRPVLDKLDIGLVTTVRPDQVPPGGAVTADNVRLYPKGIRQALGTKRIVSERFRAPAVDLNGRTQYFFGRLQSAGTALALTGTSFSVEVFFRLTSLKAHAMILMKGVGGNEPEVASPGIDWSVSVHYISSSWQVIARFYDGVIAGLATTVAKSTDSGGAVIIPGVDYHVAFGRDGANFFMYLHRIGAVAGSAATTAVPGIWAGQQDLATSDFYVGAFPNTTGYRLYDRGKHHFPGVIQEIRVWPSNVLSTTDIEANDEVQMQSGPAFLWRLTGWNGASWAPTAGGAAPTLILLPVDAVWSTLGGSNALAFDGHYSGFPILDSYRLRQPTVSLKGNEGEIDAYAKFMIFGRVRFNRLVKQTVLHWTHFTDDEEYRLNYPPDPTVVGDYNGSITAALGAGMNQEIGNLVIQLTTHNGSDFRLRLVLWVYNFTTSAYTAFTASTGTLAASTDYAFAFVVDQTARTIGAYLDGALINATSYAAGTDVQFVPRTSDDPQGSRVKYWLSVGRGIKDSRRGNNFPGDPNDVDVRYRTDKTLDGKLRQLGLAISPTNESHLAAYVAANDITRNNALFLDGQLLMLLPMVEGRGEQLEDFGIQGIGAAISTDPRHRQFESRIAGTIDKSPTLGIAHYEYRDPASSTGIRKKGVLFAGASVYEASGGFGTTPATIMKLADGIRNDDQNKVSIAAWRDSLIVCTGRGRNYHLVRDQLHSLHIDPLVGFVPFGLTDIGSKRANLEVGVYRYAFLPYSSFTGKFGPVGPFCQVEIRHGRANVAFGAGQEIQQTYPRTGDSTIKEDFDMSSKSCIIKIAAWNGTSGAKAATDPEHYESQPGSGGANEAKLRRCVFTDDDGEKNSFIKKKKDVSALEVKAVIEDRQPKVRVEARTNGKVEVLGDFPGTRGFLRLEDTSGTNMIGVAAGVIGFTGSSGTPKVLQLQGDGETDGPNFFFSDDPQTTHIAVFRTTASGGEYRLHSMVPNGDTKWIDSRPDTELVGEPLRITSGFPPPCKHVVIKDGIAFYFGNKEFPYRVWFSKLNEPWNVPPQQIIDITDGDTLEVIQAIKTEYVLALMKRHETFVLNVGGGLGFSIETRINDIGAVSGYGGVVDGEVAYYPAEKGFYRFDGTTPKYLSKSIEPTFQAIPAQYLDKIVAANYRPEEDLFFFFPSGDTLINGVVENDSALVMSLGSTTGQAWTRRTGLPVKFCRFMLDSNGQNRLYLVDAFGFVSVMGDYGAYGPDTSIVVSKTAISGDTTTAVVTQLNSAVYPHGYLGFPVTVVDATNGTRATRIIISDDLATPNSTLTFDHALPFDVDSGDAILFGSIEALWVTGEIQLAAPMVSHVHRVFLGMEAQTVEGTFIAKIGGIDGQSSDDTPASRTFPNTTIAGWNDDLKSRGFGHQFTLDARGVSKRFELTSLGFDFTPADLGKKLVGS